MRNWKPLKQRTADGRITWKTLPDGEGFPLQTVCTRDNVYLKCDQNTVKSRYTYFFQKDIILQNNETGQKPVSNVHAWKRVKMRAA